MPAWILMFLPKLKGLFSFGKKLWASLPRPVKQALLIVVLASGLVFAGRVWGRHSIKPIVLPPAAQPGVAFIDSLLQARLAPILAGLQNYKPRPILIPAEDSDCQKYVDLCQADFQAYRDANAPALQMALRYLEFPDSLQDTYHGVPGWDLQVMVYPKLPATLNRFDWRPVQTGALQIPPAKREDFLSVFGGVGWDGGVKKPALSGSLQVGSWMATGETLLDKLGDWRLVVSRKLWGI